MYLGTCLYIPSSYHVTSNSILRVFIIVTFDIKTLVPWHHVVYTLCISCGRLVMTASFKSSSFAKRLLARCSFIFGNRKKVRRSQIRTVRNNSAYHVTRSDVQLHEETFRRHTEHQKQNSCADSMRKLSSLSGCLSHYIL